MPQDILLLYATQTGNSRGIAKDISDRAITKGHKARVVGMENFKDVDWEAESVIVVVASCTGNGDCPDNGDKFFRFCKRKTTPPFLDRTNFAVCSLGDSNYDAFCSVGKEFDKNFERLGGSRFVKRVDVDEVEGIETFVEPWLDKLWVALDALPPKGAAPPKPSADSPTAGESAVVPPTPSTVDATAPAATGAAPAKPKAAAGDDDEPIGTSADKPLTAPVSAARWLTKSGRKGGGGAIGTEAGERRVIHVEIDVSGAPEGAMNFEPGDALGVLPRNAAHEVSAVLAALKPAGGGGAPVPKLPDGSALPGHLAGCKSVEEALTSRVDIGSVSVWPPLPLLRMLVASSAPAKPGDSNALLVRATSAIASPPTAAAREAHASLQRERPSLSELLTRMQSTPPLAPLLDVLPPLAPRFYSISNSPAAAAQAAAKSGGGAAAMASPSRIELCLSIVQYYSVAPDGTRTAREGLCSNMIGATCAPLLAQPLPTRYNGHGKPAAGDASAPITLEVFKREASGFELRLPSTPSTPLILIGPGTGLAPFRSFLQHRRYTHERNKLGPCHVFFGCRDEHEDFLYGDELSALSGSGAIKLHTAFSRSAAASEAGFWRGCRVKIPYVQDRIEEQAAELCDLLYERDGRIYVCGDGQAMAKDVHDALRNATMRGLKLDEAAAEAELAKLSAEGRYCREIWN